MTTFRLLRRPRALRLVLVVTLALLVTGSVATVAQAQGPIGAAKGVQSLVSNGNGTFTVIYRITVENFGTTPLFDIQVEDDLSVPFIFHRPTVSNVDTPGEYHVDSIAFVQNSADPLTANNSFDGLFFRDMLVPSAGGSLAAGEVVTLDVSVTFFPDYNRAPFDNQVEARGDNVANGSSQGNVTDLSVAGFDPDGTDADDNPDEAGPTPLPLVNSARAGLAKASGPVTNNGNGTFDATFTFTLQNFGNVPLFDVQVVDVLSTTFGTFESSAAALDAPAEYTVAAPVVTLNGAAPLTPNALFDGSLDTNLLDVTAGGSLGVGERITIDLTVTFFPDFNQAPFLNEADLRADLAASGTTEGVVVDDSVDGLDPDGGDGDANPDEFSPTQLPLTAAPRIGIAKNVQSLTPLGDGRYDLVYRFPLENFGDFDLFDVQVVDSLAASFGTFESTAAAVDVPGEYTVNPPVIVANTASPLSPNAAYDGTTNVELLNVVAGGSLVQTETAEIELTITFFPDFARVPFANQATARADVVADGVATGETIDASVDGPDPDGTDNDNLPDETSPTVLALTAAPSVGVAKRTLAAPIENGDGTFTVTYDLVVRNYGNGPLFDVQVTDSLTASFGVFEASAAALDAPGEYTVGAVTLPVNATTPFTPNASFDGSADANLLDVSAGGDLDVGESIEVEFTLTFFPDFARAPFPNQARARADLVADAVSTGDTVDLSVDGADPDGADADNNPDESSPTTLSLAAGPSIGVAKRTLAPPSSFGDGAFLVTYAVVVENFGNGPLFDVQVVDSLLAAFGTPVADSSLVDGAGEYWVGPVTLPVNAAIPFSPNPAFDGATNSGLLNVAAGGSLPVGSTIEIEFPVRYFPDFALSPFPNSARATGDLAANAVADGDVSDASVNGSDPDGTDNDGVPDESSATTIVLTSSPSVGIAKRAGAVSSNGNGTFDVTYSMVVENFGNRPLFDLQVGDALGSSFGNFVAQAVDVDAPGEYTVGAVTFPVNTATPLSANPAFDGAGNVELLSPLAGGDLDVGETFEVEFTVTFFPDFGRAPFPNQATVAADLIADGVVSGDVSDISVDGSDPDGTDADGNPDESSPTLLPLAAGPRAGIAKSAGVASDNGDGTFDVTYNLFVENFGNVPLYDVQVTDTLLAAFGAYQAQVSLVDAPGEYTVGPVSFPVNALTPFSANPAFNGASDTSLLDPTAGGALNVLEVVELEFTVTFFPDFGRAPFPNSADLAADLAADGVTSGDVVDASVSGIDPDGSDGDGDPDESSPTTLALTPVPRIGAAKQAGAVSANGDGSFDVAYTVRLENFGNLPLVDIQATDVLTTAFGTWRSSRVDVDSAGEYTVSAVTIPGNTTTPLSPNPGFNGSSDTALLDVAAAGDLDVFETADIFFTVTFFPDFTRSPFPNQAAASGDIAADGVANGDTTDLSTDGADPDGIDDDRNPDESSPTILTLTAGPSVGVAKNLNSLTANGDGTFDVSYSLLVENFGNVPLFDLQLTDDLTGPFGNAVADTSLVGAAGEFAVRSIVLAANTSSPLFLNRGFDGAADAALLDPTAGGTLNVFETFEIELVVRFFPDFGRAPFGNQATVAADLAADGATNGDVTDLSVSGADPDGTDGDNDPDESSPTTLPLSQAPTIGVAKELQDLQPNGDGTYQVTYAFIAQNFGNVPLFDLQLTDSLTPAFGALVATAGEVDTPGEYFVTSTAFVANTRTPLTLDAAFDGSAVTTLLNPAAGGDLDVGEGFELTVTLVFYPDFTRVPFGNSAIALADASADGVTTGDTTDDSVAGFEPDADGNGLPDDSSPTTLPLLPVASIGAAKSAVVSGTDVTIDLVLANLGNHELRNVSALEDLDAAFGAGLYSLSSAPVIVGPADGIVLNPAFDGATNTELLDPVSTLRATARVGIRFTVSTVSFGGSGLNQVGVSAEGFGGAPTSDLSDDGTEPDPDGDGNANEPGENDPTPVTPDLPQVGVAKTSFVSGDQITYVFFVDNGGNAEGTNLSLPDDFNAVFGAGNFAVRSIRKVTGPATFNENPAFTGSFTGTELIAPGSSLAPGEAGSIEVVVDVTRVTDRGDGFGLYSNTVFVSANGPGGLGGPFVDESVDGTDPDPEGDGPGDNRGSTLTQVENPVIGLAKQGSFTGTGPFSVTFDFFVENFGVVDLTDVQIVDDFDQVFGAGNYTLTSAPVVVADPGGGLVVNPAFNGSSDPNLLAPGSTLSTSPGLDVAQVRVTLTISTGGVYFNEAFATATSPMGAGIFDNSVNGPDPDPDADGDPRNNESVTPIGFESPALGVAKDMTFVPQVSVGSNRVLIDFYFENFGNTPLQRMSVEDDLDVVFGAGNWTLVTGPVVVAGPPTFTVNPVFSGSGSTTELLGLGLLGVAETAQVRVEVDVDTQGVYENQVTAFAESPTGTSVSDVSTAGTDPDADGNDADGTVDGDGVPDENRVTRLALELAVIGLGTQVDVSGFLPFRVEFNFFLQNYGTVEVDSLALFQDLATAFGAGNFTIVEAPTIVADTGGTLVINPAYDGIGDRNLLSSGLLSPQVPDDRAQVRMVVDVAQPGAYTSLAVLQGRSEFGNTLLSDPSAEGSDPDPDGDGDPGNNTQPIVLTLGGDFIRMDIQTPSSEVVVGDLIRYVLTAENTTTERLENITLQSVADGDVTLVEASGRLVRSGPDGNLGTGDDISTTVQPTSLRPLEFAGITLQGMETISFTYLLRVGAAASPGALTNRATPRVLGGAIGNTASSTVVVVADPLLGSTTVLGKVFYDYDEDSVQDAGEPGAAGVTLATSTGLLIETDAYGRYHLADVDVPSRERGRNFILKLDPGSLPPGSRLTTENPRVLHLTAAMMNRINFGVKPPAAFQRALQQRNAPVIGELDLTAVTALDRLAPNRASCQLRLNWSADFQLPQVEIEDTLPAGATYVAGSARWNGQAYLDPEVTGSTLRWNAQDVAPGSPVTLTYGISLVQAASAPPSNAIRVSWRTSPGGPREDSGVVPSLETRTMRLRRIQEVAGPRIEVLPADGAEPPVPRSLPSNGAKDLHVISLEAGGVLRAALSPGKPQPALDVVGPQDVLMVHEGTAVGPIRFAVHSNYAQFFRTWELSFYRAEDDLLQRPVRTLTGTELEEGSWIVWDGKFDPGKVVLPGHELQYVLRVRDALGHVDETRPRTLLISASERASDVDPTVVTGGNNLLRQTIAVEGSALRLSGDGLPKGASVRLGGRPVAVDREGRLVHEEILPMGSSGVDWQVQGSDGEVQDGSFPFRIGEDSTFLVGIADLVVGDHSVEGDKTALSNDSHFDESSFAEGRLAFYLKALRSSRYRFTAQFDSGTEELKNLFQRLGRKDPQALFRRLDPDRFYAAYGDGSTTVSDVDTQGRFYARFEWDRSRALWGNYTPGLTGTEFGQFNRSFYGGLLQFRSPQITRRGDPLFEATGFASEAQSAFGHNEFLGTGGSLYYLRHTDIVQGSQKVWIEVRDRDSERLVESVPLRRGQDYELDEIQGRVILSRPLLQVAEQAAPAIIRDGPLDGNQVRLIVDYEYVPSGFSGDEITTGGRARGWINDDLGLGATLVTEERGGQDYRMRGVDLTLRRGRGTYLKGEFADSRAQQTAATLFSTDGGVTFADMGNPSEALQGQVRSIEGRLDWHDIDPLVSGPTLGAWIKDRTSGFSTARLGAGGDRLDYGGEFQWQTSERFAFGGRWAKTDLDNLSENRELTLGAQAKVTPRVSVGGELRHRRVSLHLQPQQKSMLGGLRLGIDVLPGLHLFAKGQGMLSNTNAQDNNLATLGLRAQATSQIAVRAEGSVGDRGNGALMGADLNVDPSHTLYGTYTLSTDVADGSRGTFTLGQRKALSHQLDLFTENQFTHGERQSGIGQIYGLNLKPRDHWKFSATLQRSDLDTPVRGEVDRTAVSIGGVYRGRESSLSMRAEFRSDDLGSTEQLQWLTSNRFDVTVNPELTMRSKFNLSITENRQSSSNLARFVEAGAGLAYRPIRFDRLNILAKYTFLLDQPAPGQLDLRPDQRSSIFSLESLYDLDPRIEVGGRFALRTGDQRDGRDTGQWYGSRANLAVVRARAHVRRTWDGVLEYRWLWVSEAQDMKRGFLAGAYRHIDDYLKLGVGYNFTSFSDDLTDLDFDQNGWFLNLVGKY